MLNGMFDLELRLRDLDEGRDPLARLDRAVDWELFRAELETIRPAERKSNAGRKPIDAVRMFKILVLQSLYNLSDEATEYQLLDRLTFMRFAGLSLGEAAPDAKTIWLFRQRLTEAGLIDRLFEEFEGHLREKGFAARKGQMIDASIVAAARTHNTRQEDARIRQGETPEEWSPAQRRQKDVDARWIRQGARFEFGYKNHIGADVEHKLIRSWEVSSASAHDGHWRGPLLDPDNADPEVYADSAYCSARAVEMIGERGLIDRLHRRPGNGRKLSEEQKGDNRGRARIRVRVEHVFAAQKQRAGNLIVRTVGLIRARTKIGLRNLAYNLSRFEYLTRRTA